MKGKINPRYSRQAHTIQFVSRKMNDIIRVESFSEKSVAYRLEFDPRVTKFMSQPFSFEVPVDGKIRRYTPDFLACYRDGSARFIEVHQNAQLNSQYQRKLAVFEALIGRQGFQFEYLEAVKIKGAYLANCAIIKASRSMSLPKELSYCDLPNNVELAALIEHLEYQCDDPNGIAMELFAQGIYAIPVNAPLLMSTVVSQQEISV